MHAALMHAAVELYTPLGMQAEDDRLPMRARRFGDRSSSA
jgi:hypothetical protein